MLEEKEKYILDELERLVELKSIVTIEKHLAEKDNESDDMTITDLEEWLIEIDLELATIRSKQPAIAWLFDKYFG